MAFQIEIITKYNNEVIQLSDNELGVSIDILSLGALMNRWELKQHDLIQNFVVSNEYHQGNWHFEKNGFRGAKMSPYVCRLYKGTYVHLNKHYTMDHYYLGEHSIHGLLYDAPFEIQSTILNDHSASVTLQYIYRAKDKGFPFNYFLLVTWTLEKNNKVSVTTEVTNESNVAIPMGDGWHPYFTLGESIDHCRLQFLCSGKMEYDAALIPTCKLMMEENFAKGKKIGTTHLDDGFVLDPMSPNCSLENEKYILKIMPSSSYGYLQLYIPPDRKSIAIENLSCAPNAFNNKMGLQILKPHDNIIFETSYQIITK